MKYVGREFPHMIFPTNYSQVVNNHYYFLRADEKRNYTVYRDKGGKLVEIDLDRGITFDVCYADLKGGAKRTIEASMMYKGN